MGTAPTLFWICNPAHNYFCHGYGYICFDFIMVPRESFELSTSQPSTGRSTI